MRVTLKQIAEMAGVHRSTVDKVLHQRPGISDEVRQRVQSIIDEVGYKPNIIGKALASQNRPISIAVVLMKIDALAEIQAGIEEAYNEYRNFGLELNYYYINNADEDQQLSLIEHLKNKNLSGMIISPINSEKIKDAINDISETGVPVITVNSDIPDSKRLCFVGQDLYKSGYVAGSLMGEILKGTGKVAIVTGSNSIISSVLREQGFREIISEKYPDIDIVLTVETYEEKVKSFQKTIELLNTVDDLDGIYITCGSASEVAKAVRLMNKEKDIKIICFDLYPEIVELVKSGVINFTIGQDSYSQGYKSVKVIFEYLFYKKNPEHQHINTGIDIRLKENIELY